MSLSGAGTARLGRFAASVLLLAASAACIPHPDGTPSSSEDPVLILVVGDSLTAEYGPVFHFVAEHQGAWVFMSYSGGSNPVDSAWAEWVSHHANLDYVIIQDQATLGTHPWQVNHTMEEYLAAWQELVDTADTVTRPAHPNGVGEGEVIVLKGTHPDLSTIRGIDRMLPMVPFDEGTHWSQEGVIAQAHQVCEQLSQGQPCPR